MRRSPSIVSPSKRGRNDDVRSVADDLVANALACAFPIDPVVGPVLSHAISVISSVIRRHGLAIQASIAAALAESGRFEVRADVSLPVTRTALDLVASKTAAGELSRIALQADAAIDRTATVDLLVIDENAGWAGVYDVKRGLGQSDYRKRKMLQRDLLALRLILPSYVRRHGAPGVDVGTSAIIDYYGGGGFAKEISLQGSDLDGHFGVEVSTRVDAMTRAVSERLHQALPALFAVGGPQSAPAVSPDEDEDLVLRMFDKDGRLRMARPVGPGARGRRGDGAGR